MKKLIFKSLLLAAVAFGYSQTASAQFRLSVNIGSQPAWGPSGYNHVDYYYLPDIESYYDVATSQYIYDDGGRWIYSRTLPPRYGNYDLYSGYKVVVNRPKPYLNFAHDRTTYAHYRNWRGAPQPMLREHRTVNNRTVVNRTTVVNHDRNMGRGTQGNYNQRNDHRNNGHENGGHDNGGHDNGGHNNQGHDDHGHH